MAKIFHLVQKDDWAKAKSSGSYHPASLEKEGFIHCSKADQLLDVANLLYKGCKDLIALRIVESAIESELKLEPPVEAPWSEVYYPHIYGELNLNAVEKEIEFPCQDDGSFQLPADLLSD